MAENIIMSEAETLVLEKFKKMVLAEEGLYACTEDEFLLRFLKAKDFDTKKALQLIVNYYKLRVQNAELYKDFRPSLPKLRIFFEQNVSYFLPQRDERGRSVLAIRDGKWDTTKSHFDDLYICFHLALESEIRKPETQKNGIVIIHDVIDVGLQHVKHSGPANFKKFLFLIEQGFPIKVCEIHFVNVNVIFKMIHSFVRPLMTKEFKEKLFLHRNYEELHKYVDPKILPFEFGGNKDFPFDNSEAVKRLLQAEDDIVKLNKYGYKKD